MSIHTRGTDPHEPLEAVLRAATAPGHVEELAGEEKVMAAFRAAVPAPRRRSLFARVLTVKALVVGAVATSTGVVLATAGGVIPMWQQDPPSVETPAPSETPNPASVAPPPRVNKTTTKPPATTSTPDTPPAQPDLPNQHPGPGKGDKDGRDGKDRGGPGGFSQSSPPPTSEEDIEEDTQPSGPPSSRPETPDSPAHGAVTAVPPNGAVPPTPGD